MLRVHTTVDSDGELEDREPRSRFPFVKAVRARDVALQSQRRRPFGRFGVVRYAERLNLVVILRAL